MINISLIAYSFCIGSLIGNNDLALCISNNLDDRNIGAQSIVYNDLNNTITYTDICILKLFTDNYTLYDVLVGVEYSHEGDTSFVVDPNYDINNLSVIYFTYNDIDSYLYDSYINIRYTLNIDFQFGAIASNKQSLNISYDYRVYYDNYNYSSFDNYPTYPFIYKYSINVSNTDYLIGYNDGFTEGYDRGYYEGSNDLNNIFNGDYLGWLSSAIGNFFDIEIFPNFTLGGAIGAVIACYLMIWILKVFAGG